MEDRKSIGEALARCIESSYGLKTAQYYIWEHTERVLNELLEKYLDLLDRKGVKCLNVVQNADEMAIIRYVDIQRRGEKDDWFFDEYREIFRAYRNEHDEFELSVKGTIWGSPEWESKDIIAYITDLTKVYNYVCFRKELLGVVNAVLKKYFEELPEILPVPGMENWAYLLQVENDCFASKYACPEIPKKTASTILTKNGVPFIKVVDERGVIKPAPARYGNEEAPRYKSGFRLDLDHMVRSSWEANVARIFRKIGIHYDYEREYYAMGDDIYYVPDFFLPNNIIVEVKGFWDADSRNKVAAMQKNHPEFTILPIDYDMYESLRLRYAPQIPEWEDNIKTKIESEDVSIVGMKFSANKETLHRLSTGDTLFFEREPNNSFDKNAILVKTKAGEPVGHVSGDWTAVYAPKLDVGMTYRVIVTSIQPRVIHVEVKRDNSDKEILYSFFK